MDVLEALVAATSDQDQVSVQPDEDRAFWDLVLADDDWLLAEFDTIVTRAYPHRSDRDRPCPRWPDPLPPGARLSPRVARPTVTDAPVRPAPRQRSPPPRG